MEGLFLVLFAILPENIVINETLFLTFLIILFILVIIALILRKKRLDNDNTENI